MEKEHSDRKLSFIIILGTILFLAVSYYPFTAMADCPCEGDECYKLSVQVLGYEDYVVHDELVMIRYLGGNESSPVLYENRTVTDGVAYFCIEGGEYWIDVRNIWVNLTIDGDIDFVFPYLLFDDVENPTDDNETPIPENPSKQSVMLWVGIVVVILTVMMLSLLIIEKRSKK